MGSQRAAILGCVLLSGAAGACELVLSEHRGGRELARVPLAANAPTAQIAFTHSVLGTPVADRYEWRSDAGQWRAYLVEERFEGEGYGLPNAAGPGETLTRDGKGWRLQLNRLVHPLLVRPVRSQQTRLLVEGRAALLLESLSLAVIELHAMNCKKN